MGLRSRSHNEHKEMTETCQHCGSVITTYKYPLDDLDVSTLRKVWEAVVKSGRNDVDVSNIGLKQTERLRMTQLRFHGMVAKVKNEFGKQVGNHWLITDRAGKFLRGEIRVPSYVLTRQNRVIGHSNDPVGITDFRVLDDFRATYEIIDGGVREYAPSTT